MTDGERLVVAHAAHLKLVAENTQLKRDNLILSGALEEAREYIHHEAVHIIDDALKPDPKGVENLIGEPDPLPDKTP